MMGVTGGVCSEELDVRLGDIEVSMFEDGRPGVVPYDYSQRLQDKELKPKATMNIALVFTPR